MLFLAIWMEDLWFHNITLVINRYMSTLGNKKLELFDTGAGSSQPMTEENVQLASGKIFLLITLILGNMVSWCRFLVYSYAYAYLIEFYVYFFFTYFMWVFEIFFICRDLSIFLVFDFNFKSFQPIVTL